MEDRISCGQHPSRKLLHTLASSNLTLNLFVSPKTREEETNAFVIEKKKNYYVSKRNGALEKIV